VAGRDIRRSFVISVSLAKKILAVAATVSFAPERNRIELRRRASQFFQRLRRTLEAFCDPKDPRLLPPVQSLQKQAQQATDFLLHARFEGLVLGRNPREMETVVEILRHVTLLVETRDSGWLLLPEGPPVRRDMEQLFGQVLAGAGRRAENFAGADEQLLQPSRPVITGDDVMEGIRRDRSLQALPIEEVEVIIRQINLVSRFAQLDEAFAHALRPRAPELTLAPA
jgi:hypothetical protein